MTANGAAAGNVSVSFFDPHRLEKRKCPLGKLPEPLHEEGAFGPAEGISESRLRDLVQAVKAETKAVFVQNGVTVFMNGGPEDQ